MITFFQHFNQRMNIAHKEKSDCKEAQLLVEVCNKNIWCALCDDLWQITATQVCIGQYGWMKSIVMELRSVSLNCYYKIEKHDWDHFDDIGVSSHAIQEVLKISK